MPDGSPRRSGPDARDGRSGELDAELRAWAAARRFVLGELLALAAATAGVVRVGPVLAAGPPEHQAIAAALLLAHGAGAVAFVQRVVTLLVRECPRCRRGFYGLPRALPFPLRRACAHCGLRLAPRPSAGSPAPQR